MPFFYLQCIVPMTDCRLVDGFTYALAGNTVLAPLRIDDDDVVGTFKHTGNTGALVAQVKMKVVPVIP